MSRLCACETAAACSVPAGSQATDLSRAQALPPSRSSRAQGWLRLWYAQHSPSAGLDVPTPWFTPLHPSQVSALLARAEEVKQGGEQVLAYLKSPQRSPGFPLLHPSSPCYVTSFPGIQTVFLKEWHPLKVNESWQYVSYRLIFEPLPSEEKSIRKRMEQDINQHYQITYPPNSSQFQWLWWSCKWDCRYMWTETIGPNQWHAVIRPPVLQETHWTKLIKHTMRDTRDHIWATTGSSSLTRVPKLKLHQYFSWCIAVGSFCLKVKQNVL